MDKPKKTFGGRQEGAGLTACPFFLRLPDPLVVSDPFGAGAGGRFAVPFGTGGLFRDGEPIFGYFSEKRGIP